MSYYNRQARVAELVATLAPDDTHPTEVGDLCAWMQRVAAEARRNPLAFATCLASALESQASTLIDTHALCDICHRKQRESRCSRCEPAPTGPDPMRQEVLSNYYDAVL